MILTFYFNIHFLNAMQEIQEKVHRQTIQCSQSLEDQSQSNSNSTESKIITQYPSLNPKLSYYINEAVLKQLCQEDIFFLGKNPQLKFDSFAIKHIKRSKNSQILQLDVHIGFFNLWIKILNFSGCSLTNQNFLIDSGTHGHIYAIDFEGNTTAIKSIKLNRLKLNQIEKKRQWLLRATKSTDEKNKINFKIQRQIQKAQKNYINLFLYVIREYSINKIFSALRIGPKIFKKTGFDIIIYDDRAEFEMELCVPIKYMPINQSIAIESSLKTDLQLMHLLHFVHLDIKPLNILYSKIFSKFIFCDFGCSKCIPEDFGSKTYIEKFIGTYLYSSDEMKRVMLDDCPSCVDLYNVDIVGLAKTLEQISKQIAPNDACFPEIIIADNKSFKQILQLNRLKHELYFSRNLKKIQANLCLNSKNKQIIQQFIYGLKPNNYLKSFYTKFLRNTCGPYYLNLANNAYGNPIISSSNKFIIDFNMLINCEISSKFCANSITFQQNLLHEKLYVRCMMHLQLLKQSKSILSLTVDNVLLQGMKLTERLQKELSIDSKNKTNNQSLNDIKHNYPFVLQEYRSSKGINLLYNLCLIFKYSEKLELTQKIALLKKIVSLLFYIQIDLLMPLLSQVLSVLIQSLPQCDQKLDYKFIYGTIFDSKIQTSSTLCLQQSQETQLRQKLIELKKLYLQNLLSFSNQSRSKIELFLTAYFGLFQYKYNRGKLKYTFLLATTKIQEIFFMNEQIAQQIDQILAEDRLDRLDLYFIQLNRMKVKKLLIPQYIQSKQADCRRSMLFNFNMLLEIENQKKFDSQLLSELQQIPDFKCSSFINYKFRTIELVKNVIYQKIISNQQKSNVSLTSIIQVCLKIITRLEQPSKYIIRFCSHCLHFPGSSASQIKRIVPLIEKLADKHPELYFAIANHYLNLNQYQKVQYYATKCLQQTVESKKYIENYVLNYYVKYFYLRKLNQARKCMSDIVNRIEARQLSLHLLGFYSYLLLKPFAQQQMSQEFFKLFDCCLIGLHFYNIAFLYHYFYLNLIMKLDLRKKSNKFLIQLLGIIENSKYWQQQKNHDYLMAILHFEVLFCLSAYRQKKPILFRIAKKSQLLSFKLKKLFDIRFYFFMLNYIEANFRVGDEDLLRLVNHRYQRAQYRVSIFMSSLNAFVNQSPLYYECPKKNKKSMRFYDKLNEKVFRAYQNRFRKYRNQQLISYRF